jgi:surface polysaccharide O-acyltransferase-like enzyme
VSVAADRSREIQYINRLRIIGIYAVVTAHVAIWLTMATPAFTANWWLGCWIFYLGHFAIPVFVMISGALLLGNGRGESAIDFYKRRMYRVGIPLVVWTVVYLVVRRVVHGEHLTVQSVTTLILTGNPYYHLWFMYMIVGLYLITPALRVFVQRSSRRRRLFVIAAVLILANIYFQLDAIFWNHPRFILTTFIPFIAYYLCGYELRLIDPRRVPSRYLVAVVAASVIYLAAFSGLFLETKGGVGTRYLFDFFSLPMVFLSIGVFWAAYLHDMVAKPPTGVRRTALEWVASTTLGIYILHPLVLDYIWDRLKNHAGDGTFLAGVILVPLVTFAACYLVTSILMNIPVLRRTVC